ncbi:MAG TPA: ABC transporter substrate-binding protein [Bradyrhizobium sp.]|jgi:putative ABC transport system substrate-binding protein
MKRRDAIKAIAASAVAWPLVARAQRAERIRHVGILTGRPEDPESLSWVDAFRRRLGELGWSDGRNVRIDLFADGDVDRWQGNAHRLVAASPDVIIVAGNPGVSALQRETSTIPIVFVQVGDPVGSGFVESLAHPGGNVTGFMHFEPAMGAKWLEVLKAIAPTTARALVLYLPEAVANLEFVRSAEAAQGTYDVVVSSAGIHKAEDIEKAIAEFAREPNGGLIVLPNPISGMHRALIAETAIRHRLPSIAVFRNMTVSGILACYGIEVANLYRRAAEYTDRLLRGEKAKDLPVQLPTRYELIVNMKTATALGLEIPPMLLARVDEVIE